MYLRPQTYTVIIVHQRRSTELAAILRGKLIGGAADKNKIRIGGTVYE